MDTTHHYEPSDRSDFVDVYRHLKYQHTTDFARLDTRSMSRNDLWKTHEDLHGRAK